MTCRTEPMAGNMTETTTLNNLGQIAWSHGSTTLDGYQYAYNADGQVTNRNDLINGSQNQTFGYDKLGHLAAWGLAANNFPNLLFTLDSQGNRLSTTATQSGSSTTTTLGVNSASDQLNSESYNAGEPRRRCRWTARTRWPR